MHSKQFLFIVALMAFILLSCTSEQETMSDINPEKELIEETIEKYFQGWLTGDTTLLGTAMHKTCQLKNIKDDNVVIFNRSKYLSFFKPRPKLQNAGGRILDIDVTGPIGSAKVELETPERLFTDYFNLMKVKNQWHIVDKISTNVPKK